MSTPKPLPSTIAHLDALTASGGVGWLVISGHRAGRWRSWSFATDDVDAAAYHAARLDDRGANVYVRANLLRRPLDHPAERGSASDTGAVIALVVDLDVAGPGHKPGPADRLPLPPTTDEALAIVDALPTPSLTIQTGGGVHLWWLLDQPIMTDPVGVLDQWADRMVEAGRRQGWHVDRPDPARVLRLCGTHRRKPGIDINRVTLADVAGWPDQGLAQRPWCPTSRYDARTLLDVLPQPEPARAASTAARTPSRAGSGVGPADAIGRLDWSTILEPLGWTFTGTGQVGSAPAELWQRPGDPSSSYSIKCLPDGPAVAWSDSCGLPVGRGQRLNKWRVFVALHFGGDEVAAARAIRTAARGTA